jgi:hypothetical protein
MSEEHLPIDTVIAKIEESYGDSIFLLQGLHDKYPHKIPGELELLSEYREYMRNIEIIRQWELFVANEDVKVLTPVPTLEEKDLAEVQLRSLHAQRQQQ